MRGYARIVAIVGLTIGLLQGAAPDPEESASAPQGHNLLLEGGNAALLATRSRFYITYKDKVSGGCLPKPSRLRDKLELAMRRNHLQITAKKGGLADSLELSALGFKAGRGYCAVSLTLTMESWVPMKVPYAQGNPDGEMTLVPYQFVVGQYLLTGKRSGMQKRLEKVATELGDQLYLQISRSRDEIFRNFPMIERNFRKAMENAK